MLLRPISMTRIAWFVGGLVSLAFGVFGALLPLLPTVPFLILAAFCFARGHPRLERWLVEHRRFGPPVQAWRNRGAIGPRAKFAALAAFTLSAAMGLALLAWPWAVVSLVIAIVGGSWVVSRPSR